MARALSTFVTLQAEITPSRRAPKLWGMISLTESSPISLPRLSVDVIVVLDISTSMRLEGKIESAKKAIEDMLDKLEERHTFSLIGFTHEVELMYAFLKCTPENKALILAHLRSIEPKGSTNLISALRGVSSMISGQKVRSDTTAIFLISDGDLVPYFPYEDARMKLVDQIPPIQNCSFNVIGIGKDVESIFLYYIALHFRGVYHFVEETPKLGRVTNECLINALHTRIRNLQVLIKCKEGCRIIKSVNRGKCSEKSIAKDYMFELGSLSVAESATIVFRLSLKKLDSDHTYHPLASFESTYILPNGRAETVSHSLSVLRSSSDIKMQIPTELQYHIDRVTACKAILDSLAEEDDQIANEILENASKNVSTPLIISDLKACQIQNTQKKSIRCSVASSYSTEKFIDLKHDLLTSSSPSIACYTEYIGETQQ